MREATLDRLFLRFRGGDDPRALAQLFDRTAPSLLALARHLVRERDQAEDLVQATFLAAIERAAAWDAERPVYPWLLGILTREARLWNRRAAREIEPERLARATAPEGAAAARASELAERLEEGLRALPPRYRALVRAHLEDGRGPRDLAAASGLRPGTVRVRIHRGLALLRRALPSGLALGGLVLCSRRWAAVRNRVLDAARAAAPRGAVAGTVVPAAALGVAVMSTKTLAASSLALAAGLALWLVPRAGIGRDEAGASASTQDVAERAVLSGRGPSVAEGAALEGPSTAPLSGALPGATRVAAPIAGTFLVGEVTGLASIPEGGLQLLVRATPKVQQGTPPAWRPPWDLGGEQVHVHANGPFAFDISRIAPEGEGSVEVTVDHDDYVPARFAAERAEPAAAGRREYRAHLALEARTPVTITGRVRVPPGFEEPPVEIALFRDHARRFALMTFALFGQGGGPDERATCDAEGRFELETQSGGDVVLVAHHGALQPLSIALELDERFVDLGTVELTEGAVLAGRALFDGQPLPAGERVFVHKADGAQPAAGGLEELAGRRGEFAHAALEVRTGEGGRFRVGGLHPIDYEVTVVPGHALGASHHYRRIDGDGVLVRAPARGLEIESGLVPVVLEALGAGEPLDFVSLQRSAEDGSPLDRRQPRVHFGPFGEAAYGDGELRLLIHPERRFRATLASPGYADLELVLGPQDFGAEHRLRVELERVAARGRLEVELRCAAPGSLDGASIRALLFSATALLAADPPTVRGGVAVFEDFPPGAFQVSLGFQLVPEWPPDEQPYAIGGSLQVEESAEPERRAVCELEVGGRIRLDVQGLAEGEAPGFVLLDENGDEVAFRYLVAGEAGTGTTTSDVFVPGVPNWLGRVCSPGRYRLVMVAGDGAQVEREVVVRAGETTRVTIDL